MFRKFYALAAAGIAIAAGIAAGIAISLAIPGCGSRGGVYGGDYGQIPGTPGALGAAASLPLTLHRVYMVRVWSTGEHIGSPVAVAVAPTTRFLLDNKLWQLYVVPGDKFPLTVSAVRVEIGGVIHGTSRTSLHVVGRGRTAFMKRVIDGSHGHRGRDWFDPIDGNQLVTIEVTYVDPLGEVALTELLPNFYMTGG